MCRVRQERCSRLRAATRRRLEAAEAAVTPRVPTADLRMAAIRVALPTADTPAGTGTDHLLTVAGRVRTAAIPAAGAVTRRRPAATAPGLTEVPVARTEAEDRMAAEATADANRNPDL